MIFLNLFIITQNRPHTVSSILNEISTRVDYQGWNSDKSILFVSNTADTAIKE